MAWQQIKPVKPIHVKPREVTIKVVKPRNDVQRNRMCITVRSELLDGGLPFWAGNQKVTVAIGTGEHAGILRVSADGDFRISSLGKQNNATLIIPLPAGVRADDYARTDCPDFDYQDDWIEIKIPAGLRAEAPPAPAALQPSPSRVAAGFRTAATTPGAARPAAGGR